jgi:chromate transporter
MPAFLSPPLKEVSGLFLRLGATAFGGPAAHIALMHDEVVRRRNWLSEAEFIDLLGATNLIPGPNSTEMVIHLGYRRAGWRGAIAAGVCFVLPATLIVLGLAWLYVSTRALPQAGWLLYGIKPVVAAIIFQALWGLGGKAIKGPLTGIAAAAVFGLYFLKLNELALLLGGGLLVMLATNLGRLSRPPAGLALLGGLLNRLPGAPLAGGAASAPALLESGSVPFSLGLLFLTFLKIGSVLYGSGYVLLAFLHSDLVVRYGWLTDQQLLDAIAVGQFTPGPLFTTATFIGYLLGGAPAALLATVGIFLPAFFFVAISYPFIPRLRRSPWFSGLLDGVNAASLGLMAAVLVQIGRDALVDPLTIAAGLAAIVLLLRFRVNSTWLIAAGALLGLAKMLWS